MVLYKSNSSEIDSANALRDVHDENAHALRIRDANSRVPSEYSKVIFTKTVEGSITKAVFYRGEVSNKTRIKFLGDVADSLNGTYFEINTAEDALQYYVWYNSGTGVDPAIPGKVGVEIPYVTNDPASLITLATRKYFFESCEFFSVEPNGDDVLLIENTISGECTAANSGTTPFGITTINVGVTKRICSLVIPQVPETKYFFNEAERRFEIFPVSAFGGTVDVNIVSPDPLPVSVLGTAIASGAIQNISAPLMNTEYNFTLPLNVKRFEMKSRKTAKIQFGFNVGDSSTNYRTVEAGNVYGELNLVLTAPMIIYFQSNKDNDVIEVVMYS